MFVECGFFVYSWGCKFGDGWVFSVSERKLTLSKFVFVKDVNSFERATQEYHEHCATTNSNDSTEH